VFNLGAGMSGTTKSLGSPSVFFGDHISTIKSVIPQVSLKDKGWNKLYEIRFSLTQCIIARLLYNAFAIWCLFKAKCSHNDCLL